MERIESHGLPLGLFCTTSYLFQRISLGEGDSIVLFSDGLVEAANSAGEQYGDERLENQLAVRHSTDPSSIIGAVLGDLQRFSAGEPRHDDLTLLVLQRNY